MEGFAAEPLDSGFLTDFWGTTIMQVRFVLPALLLAFTAGTGAQEPSRRTFDQVQRERQLNAEQAFRNGRFPELREVTNVVEIGTACQRYSSKDATMCRDVGAMYMNQNASAKRSESGAMPRARMDQRQAVNAATLVTEGRGALTATDARNSLSSYEEKDAYDDCLRSGAREMGSRRATAVSSIDDYQRCADKAKADVAAARQQRREAADAKRAEAEAKEAIAEQAEKKLKECLDSPAFRLAKSADNILMYRSFIQIAKQSLERDKAIEEQTGVIDLKARKNAGEVLVDAPLEIEREFSTYRQLGGTAASADAVEGMGDPCANLR